MKNKKTISKVVGVLSTILYVVFIAFLLFALIVNFNKKPNQINGVFGYSFAVVQSGSMEPLLQVGDIVIIKQVDTDTLKVGDIIVFYDYVDEKDKNLDLTLIDTETYVDQPRTDQNLGRATASDASSSGSKLIIHRIINIYVDEYNVRFFETQGDNKSTNPNPDSNYTREDFVCAKYVQSGGFVQSIFQFVASPTGLIVVIILPVILTVVLEVFSVSKDVKNARIAEKLLTRKIKYSEVDKDKTKLAELLSEPEKVYLYDITPEKDRANLAIVLWENDVEEGLQLHNKNRKKYYQYFEEKFTAKEKKQLEFLKIKADLIRKNPQLSDEDIDIKAKEVYNIQKENAKNGGDSNSNNNTNNKK